MPRDEGGVRVSLPDDFQLPGIPPLGRMRIVDRDGMPTPSFLSLMQQWRAYNLGGCRLVACEAAGTNLITLTPTHPIAPVIPGYRDYDVFLFRAQHTSSGSVTATVVPVTGTLATLKVYKANGAAQAGSGDVVANSMYMAIFADHLDAGAGGLVLK